MSVIRPVVDAAFSMPGMVTTPDALDQLVDAAHSGAKKAIDRVAASLRRDGLNIETKVFEGRPASAIVEMARDFGPDLVVLGSHGRGQIASAVLGSVSAEVAEAAPCSVLVARRGSIGRLVLADDGSPDAMVAEGLVAQHAGLPVAAGPDRLGRGADGELVRLARARGGRSDPGFRGDARRRPQPSGSRPPSGSSDRLAAAGLTATAEVRQGDAGHEIVAAAHDVEADLIVMGTRGLSGLSKLVLGGVARSVLQHARCSVLIVRERTGSTAPTPHH